MSGIRNPKGAHHAEHETGGVDALVTLDAGILLTGTVPDARHSAAIARVASPALTGTPTAPTAGAGDNTTQIATTAFVQGAKNVPQTTTATGVQNNFPLTTMCSVLKVNNSALVTFTGFTAGVDGQQLVVMGNGSAQIDFTYIDGRSSALNQIIIPPSTFPVSIAPGGRGFVVFVYDSASGYWRMVHHEQGGWINIPYSGANFGATGGGQFVVDAGDQIAYAYFMRGRTCTVNLILNTVNIQSGTVQNLTIAKPMQAGGQYEVMGLLFDNAPSVVTPCRVFVTAGAVPFTVSKSDATAFAPSVGGTYLRFTITFEVL